MWDVERGATMAGMSKISFKLILILNIIFILSIINAIYPFIRFSSRLANYIFMIITLCIPTVLVFLGFTIKNLYKKILFIILYGIMVLVSGMFLIFTLILIAVSEDVRNVDAIGFSIIEYVQVGESRVIVYRTDGGATTSLGIIVRHEKEILPGILLVRNLYREYPRYEIEFEIKNGILLIDDIEYKLKRNIYY